ncbi:MAG: hypothetical protein E4H40_08020 [Candidatus Brocadiia bacterium]|nr:MAG: hypothetical protein E4H40_08020 [Candidatus Brocadiia bacterium]
MVFKFYSNTISNASRNLAGGIFMLGLILIGIGFLVWVLRNFFVMIFSILFYALGTGCIIFAAKILWAAHKINKEIHDSDRRENVRIHIEENHQ